MNRINTIILMMLTSVACAFAAPVKVTLEEKGGNFQLLRDGKPYWIQGASGDASKEYLKQCGGNSFRTWGIGENTQAQLDEAHKLGLTVTLGFWLGHERHGFNYGNAKAVADQLERARAAVAKFKDHPAVLMWAVGNEMEGFKEGDNPAVYVAVNDIARMIKEMDPNHPTMTVLSEIGGARVAMINKLCPDIDILGINTYGGGPSVAKRYRGLGGKKPYIITEFGPPGTWEVGKNDWGVPLELPSTAKADRYRETYDKSIFGEKDKLCLGSYVFTWGNKQEATATWYGLFLPSGERLEAIDTMTELWSGKKPENRCPRVEPLKVLGANKVAPGETIRVKLTVKDPENDPLKIVWRLEKDLTQYDTGGDTQATPPSFPEAIMKQGEPEVELKMPADGGSYWLYAVVHDTHNGAAVVNTPLFVNAPERPIAAGKTKLPLAVYADGKNMPYIGSGWMGNHAAIAMDEASTTNPHSGKVCMKLEYKAPDGFGGIIFQSPANDWGEKPGGFDLTGAKKLSFWARGENGGEKVDFVMGVIGRDKKYFDSAEASLKGVVLTKEWKQYEIDLSNKNLTQIKTGFGWTVGGQGKPVTFYVDDVVYE